jgi:hypothetical protein
MNGNPLPFTMQQPLQCERAAAKIFGSDCAIILQRFVWWTCPSNGRSKIGSLDDDGYKWVYFTLDELEGEFDWLSRSTIRRIIGLLEDNNLLISKQPEGKASRRKHYSVRWSMWLKVQSGEFCGLDGGGKLIPSAQIEHGQNEQLPSAQIEQMGCAQNEQFLTNCNVLRPLLKTSGENDQPGILAGRYLVPDEEDLKAERDSQVASLKAAPSQGEAPHVPPAPPSKLEALRLRVCKMMGRRPKTAWQDGELSQLRKVLSLGTSEEDMVALESYYASGYQYIRKDIITLLRNWNGEIDRAYSWGPSKKQDSASAQPKPFHPHQKLIDEIRSKLATHPADMERVLDSGRQPTQEESREYNQLRDKLAELMMDNGGGK